jgi:hypothetical protein
LTARGSTRATKYAGVAAPLGPVAGDSPPPVQQHHQQHDHGHERGTGADEPAGAWTRWRGHGEVGVERGGGDHRGHSQGVGGGRARAPAVG